MKKKVLSAVLSAVMVIGMVAGCGAPAAESGGSDDAKKTEKSEGIAKEDIKVGFVHISDPSDMGYTYNHDLGTQEMPVSYTHLRKIMVSINGLYEEDHISVELLV